MTKIDEDLEREALHKLRRCSSALSVSDKIEGTILLSDTKFLPV